MKNVLLVTDGIFHPPLWGQLILHSALRNMPVFTFDHVRSLEKLPASLEPFSALVLHFHHKNISPAALAKLDGFGKNGGGILAIHGATASFKETMPYFDILGGRFIGHGKVEKFSIRKVKDEIFGNIGDFEVRDELYIHELNPGIDVHFITKHENKDIPVVWTYLYGKGKVCYALPGHTSESMKNPIYQKVLQRGLEWVTNG